MIARYQWKLGRESGVSLGLDEEKIGFDALLVDGNDDVFLLEDVDLGGPLADGSVDVRTVKSSSLASVAP